MAIDRGANRQSRVYMDIRTGSPSPSRTASGAPARSPSRTPAAPGKTSSGRRRRAPQKLYHGGAGTPYHGGVQRSAEDRRAGELRRHGDEKTGWPEANGIFRGMTA